VCSGFGGSCPGEEYGPAGEFPTGCESGEEGKGGMNEVICCPFLVLPHARVSMAAAGYGAPHTRRDSEVSCMSVCLGILGKWRHNP
jgi:hypothetical protein